MTVRDWLSRGRMLDKDIAAKMAAKEQAYYDACRINGAIRPDKVQASPSRGRENLWAKIVDYELEIIAMIDKLYDIKREILSAINEIDDPLHRAVLTERYVNFKKWERIAVDLNYSFYYVSNDLHYAALSKIRIP